MSLDDVYAYSLCSALEKIGLSPCCDLYAGLKGLSRKYSCSTSSDFIIAVVSEGLLLSRWGMLKGVLPAFRHYSQHSGSNEGFFKSIFLNSSHPYCDGSSAHKKLQIYWEDYYSRLQGFLLRVDPNKDILPMEWEVLTEVSVLIELLPQIIETLTLTRVLGSQGIISANGFSSFAQDLKSRISSICSPSTKVSSQLLLKANYSSSSIDVNNEIALAVPAHDKLLGSNLEYRQMKSLIALQSAAVRPCTRTLLKKTIDSYVLKLPMDLELVLIQLPPKNSVIHSSQVHLISQWWRPDFVLLLGQAPVTNAQWFAVSKLPRIEHNLKEYPSRYCSKEQSNHPVDSVTWYEAVEFCNRISKLSGLECRLPYQVEWEFACRSNSPFKYSWGDKLGADSANTTESVVPSGHLLTNSGTSAVGVYAANRWGFYDMHGNVWEWCMDKFDILSHFNLRSTLQSENAMKSNIVYRVLCGGSWAYDSTYCESSFIGIERPLWHSDDVGFRVALNVSVR